MAQFRGRGGSRGRGSQIRGRGRGGSRGGKRASFQTARLEVQREEDSDGSDDGTGISEGSRLEGDEESSAESEVATVNPVQPYRSLLESLNVQQSANDLPRKRRKLSQPTEERNEDQDAANGLEKGGFSAENGDDLNLSDGAADEIFNDDKDQEDRLDSDDEPGDKGSDPFETHFANPNDAHLGIRLKAVGENKWTQSVVSSSTGRVMSRLPDASQESTAQNTDTGDVKSPGGLKLKSKLVEPFQKVQTTFTDLESSLAAPIFINRDVLFTARNLKNAESFRKLTCLHALNHIFKTRDRVIKNTARLARDNDMELRDQGFTRPKVLMLLPTRQSCVKMVDVITKLSDPEQQENRKRFQDSFISTNEKFSDDKPEDFRDLFGGNDDDMFRLGMKFTRKTIKYFSQFYNSDIIFASPLGLRMAIGDEEDKKQDYDFLSSIEIVVVDQTDALLMQNWEHVQYIFEHLNLQPKEAHGCDFSRVRSWYLDGNARFLRQTIVATAFATPELNGLVSQHVKNVEGLAKISSNYEGAILDLGVQIKQTFSRFDSRSLIAEPDARFKHFTSVILPSLTRFKSSIAGQGILIFIQSYLDFVRLRNHFSTSSATPSISFGSVSEYSSNKEVARARSHFYTGRHSILLYTGRAHHFRRYALRGVKQVILYSLPDNPIFYREIVGGYLGRSIADGNVIEGSVSVRSIFSKRDALSLERIVGSSRYRKMLLDQGGDTFEFL